MAKQLTPPVPIVNTVLPCNLLSVHPPFQLSNSPSNLKSMPPLTAVHAVVPAVMMLAASTALRLPGASTTQSSSTTIHCCKVPSLLEPPNTVSALRFRTSPSIQLLPCKMTLVPILADHEEEGPAEWIMPAPSDPGTKSGLCSPGSRASQHISHGTWIWKDVQAGERVEIRMSRKLREAAVSFTRTWLDPGVGTSLSSFRRS
jgi:hypothetical protein